MDSILRGTRKFPCHRNRYLTETRLRRITEPLAVQCPECNSKWVVELKPSSVLDAYYVVEWVRQVNDWMNHTQIRTSDLELGVECARCTSERLTGDPYTVPTHAAALLTTWGWRVSPKGVICPRCIENLKAK